MSFWSDFVSSDNSTVHTPMVILSVIGVCIMVLSIALLIYHCFWHGKGLDAETVKLILGLLGGGVLNAGASYFSKTGSSYFSKTATTTIAGSGVQPEGKPKQEDTDHDH